MSIVSRMTNRLPNFFQRVVYKVIPFKYRYGKAYRAELSFLEKTQWWSEKKLRKYQWHRLKLLLDHAYRNVPYYHDLFDSLKIKPRDIKTPGDFRKIPILTKELINSNFERLKAKNISQREIASFSTSGSTGIKLTFLGEKNLYQKEAAFLTRAYATHGNDLYGEKSVWLRRYVPKRGDPIYKYDYELNRLYLSAYHISPKNIRKYIRMIDAYGAKIMSAYPSSAYIFANLLEKKGLSLKHLSIVHTTSEKLPREWRNVIEECMGVEVREHYGMVEKVSLFHQCSDSPYLHEDLEYGYSEIINVRDGAGDIIGTSLNNYAMPLIRYETKDRAILNLGNKECKCGRGLPLTVKEIEGRRDDIMVTPDGRLMPGVNFYPSMATVPGVEMFKIIQHTIDKIEVQVVPGKEYSKLSENKVKEIILDRLGRVSVYVNKVKEIKRSKKTGKIRGIESKVSLDKYEG